MATLEASQAIDWREERRREILRRAFQRCGYAVARRLFSAEETESLREHYMRLRAADTYPGDFAGVDPQSEDPLKRYPRMIHMHRWDETSLRWGIDPRIADCLRAVTGTEPWMGQTMLYFKPAGARGQALHQDNWYLKVLPGTCVAAWMALDPCDVENGCLQVVTGSHKWPILCTEKADITRSFTDVTVPLPPGVEPIPVVMSPGDVMFFHGSLVHGSFPNTSADRFRRSLIGHYVTGDATQATNYLNPMIGMDGTEFEIEKSPGGGPCGVWVDRDGTIIPEIVGELENQAADTE